jgi:hypothetical protein
METLTTVTIDGEAHAAADVRSAPVIIADGA